MAATIVRMLRHILRSELAASEAVIAAASIARGPVAPVGSALVRLPPAGLGRCRALVKGSARYSETEAHLIHRRSTYQHPSYRC